MNIFDEPKMSPRPSTLVIGWGNELRGDDGAGRWVARAIAQQPHADVEALSVHQLTPELSAHMTGIRQVIFVDACPSTEVEVSRVTPPPSAEIRTHTGSPESLLNLAAWLYDAHPAAWLVGIPAEQFEMGQHFSARTETGVREALSQVERLIAEMENK